jgi:hypothetical protein
MYPLSFTSAVAKCGTASGSNRTAPPPEIIQVKDAHAIRQLVQVQVLTEGFAYGGRVYDSLSAVAKAITGSYCNGYLFFRNTLNHNKENA